jgi:diguanylate cyclase (GGDEF)-like protein
MMMIEQDKERILIVDDEPSNLKILADILKSKYTIVLAKNGIQALERAAKQAPDLILLDIIMPDMDGYKVLYEIKNNDTLKDIPVIFISALKNDADEEKGLTLGAVDYITKPFNPAIVLARVNTHIKIVRQRKLIESIALLDALTEIPNRRNYNNRLSIEWARALREKTPISLMMLDIDYFKQFNDNYGHSKGDEALKEVAAILTNILKRATDFVARIGGEEFAVLMPNTNAAGARDQAEFIRSSIETHGIPHKYSKVSEMLTVSIGGVTRIPEQEGGSAEFIETADQVLYKAKSQGRNCVMWVDQV